MKKQLTSIVSFVVAMLMIIVFMSVANADSADTGLTTYYYATEATTNSETKLIAVQYGETTNFLEVIPTCSTTSESIFEDTSVVTRGPDMTYVDDVVLTTKKPAVVHIEIPSTGGDPDTESIFDKIMNFFCNLFMKITEILIKITDAISSGVEFLIDLI